jgi:Calcineurin-like phosphoesterase/Purple acid Phosphatase, N-terminal domain
MRLESRDNPAMRVVSPALLGFSLLAAACSQAATDATPKPDSGVKEAAVDTGPPFVGRPGDLGANSPVIDHSGPNGGLEGTLQSGSIGTSWAPRTCTGTVPIATGALDAEWGQNSYGPIDKSPHAVHASWSFATDTSLAVIWETDRDTHATFLAYGSSPKKLDHFVQGVTFVNPDLQDGAVPHPLLIHETHVCGLTADQTYYYAVGGDGWYGNVYSVKTAPAVGATTSFRFAVVGDSNAFYSLYAQVAAKITTYAPDWMLFAGDLVNNGFSQAEWEEWFSAADPLAARVPTMVVHGNHEEMATGYFALFALPGLEQYYSFDYGNAHFVVLNDSPPPGEDLTGAQATFLDSDLTAAEARAVPPKWYFTSHHRPMFASDPGAGSDLSVRAAWQPIYEKHKTDVDLNGHDHHFEMTTPVLGDSVATTGGIRYVTSAGGGALFDEPTPVSNPWSIAYYAGLSFAIIDVTDTTAKVTGYRTDGTEIASFTLSK